MLSNYIYSYTFELIFFSALLILLLQHTGISVIAIFKPQHNHKLLLTSISVIFYLIEFLFLILILKYYWWCLFQYSFINLHFYINFCLLKKIISLYFYILYFTWYSSIFMIINGGLTLISNLTILCNHGLFKVWWLIISKDLLSLFKIGLIINYYWCNQWSMLLCGPWTYWNDKILIWWTYYSVTPIFNNNIFHYFYTADFYTYNLFDYSTFTFYNKYILLLFLILYYILIYYYYKLTFFNKNNKQFKFIYLFSYEYPILLGFLFLGYILVISTNNLLIVYLGFELQTFTILIISGELRNFYTIAVTNLKYFFFSFLSSLLFLLSLLYLYNFAGTFNYYEIYLYLLYNWELTLSNLFINIGLLTLFLSFFFKLGVFPFYIWVLDIFEGFPRFVTLLLLTLNKFNLYIFLLKFIIIITTFNTYLTIWILHMLTIVSLSSLFVGSLLALTQNNIHRFFGATSITHMGLLLLLIKITVISTEITSYYLIYSYFILYMLLTFLFFSILLLWSSVLTTVLNITTQLKQMRGISLNFNFIKDITWLRLFSKKSLLILVLILFNFSGFPPFSFFFIKFNLIWLLISTQFYFDTLMVLYFSTLIAGSYWRLISLLFLENVINNKIAHLYKYSLQLLTLNSNYTIIKKYSIYGEYIMITLGILFLFYNYFFYLI